MRPIHVGRKRLLRGLSSPTVQALGPPPAEPSPRTTIILVTPSAAAADPDGNSTSPVQTIPAMARIFVLQRIASDTGACGVSFKTFSDLINTLIPSLYRLRSHATHSHAANILSELYKKYLLPRSYLVKGKSNKIASATCLSDGSTATKVFHPIFRLFFHSRKGYKLPSFEREVLWLRGQKSGARGLQARSETSRAWRRGRRPPRQSPRS